MAPTAKLGPRGTEAQVRCRRLASTRRTMTDLHESCATMFRSDSANDAARCRTQKDQVHRGLRHTADAGAMAKSLMSDARRWSDFFVRALSWRVHVHVLRRRRGSISGLNIGRYVLVVLEHVVVFGNGGQLILGDHVHDLVAGGLELPEKFRHGLGRVAVEIVQ
jgi:hypothetical protein